MLRLAAHLAPVLAEVPVDPDAETAREWARAELADPVYRQGESLLTRAINWLMDLLDSFRNGISGVDARSGALLLVIVLVIAVAVVLVFTGPVRRARRARVSSEVFVDDTRTAAQMRAAAEAAAAAGRWNDAVVERFRAILRSLEERAILAERPGWTADEAAGEAGTALPGQAADLRRASRLFDDVRYGDTAAGGNDDAWLRQVDDAVRAARPVAKEVTDAEPPVPTLAVPR